MSDEPEKKKNLGGRPLIVLTDEQVAQVESLASVLTLQQIADYFGVSHVTLNAIMERQADVFLNYKRGKAKAIKGIANNLINQAQEGNTSAAVFYLKTQAGWRENREEEVQKQEQQKVIVEVIGANKGD